MTVLILNDDRAGIKYVKLLTLVQIIYMDSSLLVNIEMMGEFIWKNYDICGENTKTYQNTCVAVKKINIFWSLKGELSNHFNRKSIFKWNNIWYVIAYVI